MSNYVISISREFGSGGRLIGKRLAAQLGIPCYDRTIIQKTSEKSGLSPDFIARAEERARSRFHLSVAPVGIGTPALAHQGVPVSHQAFFAQAEVIRELADQNMTMIIVTHEMAFARDVASQVIFMDEGVIVEQGTPEQVFEHSREERTRQFLSRFTQG